jgi:four helix bundle protein
VLAGIGYAFPSGMGAKTFRELRCWQLAHELRSEVCAICAREPASKHFNFCNSFQDTASSVCRNFAEGFGRFHSAELVQFFRYALASLAELQDHFDDCLARRFIDQACFDRLHELSEHTKALALNFMKPHLPKPRGRNSRQS